MRVARKYLISGQVQGVGFRYFAYKIAQRHNIKGYVKNLYDGRVEVYAEGDQEDLNKFFAELRVGPRLAVIEDIQVEELQPVGRYRSFSIEG